VHGTAFAAPTASHNAARLKARSLYAEGEKALAAGDPRTAQGRFEEAYRTLPNAAVLLKIADCRDRDGDFPGEVEALEHYLADSPSAKDKATIQDRIGTLRKKPGTLAVKSTPVGAEIWLDGTDTSLSTPSEVEAASGQHTVTLKLPSYEATEQTVYVEFASKKDVEMTLPAITGETPTPASTAPAAPGTQPSAESGFHPTTAFWVAVGGTVVATGVTTVFGIIALDDDSKFKKAPTRSLYDDGRRAAVISDIGLGVAAASAVTAAVLFFTSKGPPKTSDQAFVVGPSFSRGGGGLVGSVRF
jgi:hypothetical protein